MTWIFGGIPCRLMRTFLADKTSCQPLKGAAAEKWNWGGEVWQNRHWLTVNNLPGERKARKKGKWGEEEKWRRELEFDRKQLHTWQDPLLRPAGKEIFEEQSCRDQKRKTMTNMLVLLDAERKITQNRAMYSTRLVLKKVQMHLFLYKTSLPFLVFTIQLKFIRVTACSFCAVTNSTFTLNKNKCGAKAEQRRINRLWLWKLALKVGVFIDWSHSAKLNNWSGAKANSLS